MRQEDRGVTRRLRLLEDVALMAEGGSRSRRSPRLGAGHVDRLTVQQAFDHLDEDEVEMLRASFFDGYSHGEIADRTDTPLGTVKSRIRRAMLKVRDFLADA